MKLNKYTVTAFVLGMLFFQIAAIRVSGSVGATPEQEAVLLSLNDYRSSRSVYFRGGLQPLILNDLLTEIAQEFLDNLQDRTQVLNCAVRIVGDPFLTRELATISDLLNRANYPLAGDRYIADFVPMVWTGIGPDQVIDQWIFEQVDMRGKKTAPSLRNSQGVSANLPVFDSAYNETGIAVLSTLEGCPQSNIYYYVIVFARNTSNTPAATPRPSATLPIATPQRAELGLQGIVNATQTAAVQATQIAPLLPTVNAILTATAAVPPSAP